ncbi:MAG: hypothetical protein AB4426_22165 [Xenococcaceae cyanobacterium]
MSTLIPGLKPPDTPTQYDAVLHFLTQVTKFMSDYLAGLKLANKPQEVYLSQD